MSESKSKFCYITVEHKGAVPFVHRGPQVKPIRIERAKFEALENMGYACTEVEDPKGAFGQSPRPVKAAEPAPQVETEDENPVTEPSPSEEPSKEESDSQESETPEVTDPEPTPDADSGQESGGEDGVVLTEEQLLTMSKADLKTLMDANGIEYKYADKQADLVKAILAFQEG